MIDPQVREALEQARDRSEHRSVTIRRDHLAHVLEKDVEATKAGRVMAGLIRSQTEDLYWERTAASAERQAHGEEVGALRVQLDATRKSASPAPWLGVWCWPLLVTLSAIGGALAR